MPIFLHPRFLYPWNKFDLRFLKAKKLGSKFSGNFVSHHNFSVWKVRRQGRKGFTEVVQYNGPATIERSFESEVETKEILNKIDEINNALLDEYDEGKEESVDDIKSEARTGSDESKNAFLLFWEQILG